MAAFDRRQCLFERESGRRAEQTVTHHVEPRLRVALGFPFGHIRRQDRRSVIDWRVDGTVLAFGVAPEMSQERILAVIPWRAITLHKVHSAVSALSGTDTHSQLER